MSHVSWELRGEISLMQTQNPSFLASARKRLSRLRWQSPSDFGYWCRTREIFHLPADPSRWVITTESLCICVETL